jgi:hypothetical protein
MVAAVFAGGLFTDVGRRGTATVSIEALRERAGTHCSRPFT